MNTPKSGDLLTKQEVFNIIVRNFNAAYSNSENYEDLEFIFESSFGLDSDIEIKYNPEKDKFEVK